MYWILQFNVTVKGDVQCETSTFANGFKTMLLKHQIKSKYFNQAAILLFFLEYDFNMQLKNVNIHI